jgi:hypothetical protein
MEQMQQMHQFMQAQQRTIEQQAADIQALRIASQSSPGTHAGVGSGSGLVREVRPPQPSTFDGVKFSTDNKSNAYHWLAEMQQYLLVANVSDDRSVVVASAYLKGMALHMWQAEQAKPDDDPTKVVCHTFHQFREWFLSHFQPIAASKTARHELRQIRQGKRSVAAYCQEFLRIVQLIPDMALPDQIDQFVFGLSDRRVSMEVDRQYNDGANKMSLIGAMDLARKEEMRLSSHYKGFGHDPRRSYNHSSWSQRASGYSQSSQQSVPMELGNVNAEDREWSDMDGGDSEDENVLNAISFRPSNSSSRRPNKGGAGANRGKRVPGLSRDDFVKLSKEGKCFRCREPGHIARDCTSQSASGQQQGKGKAQ